MPRIHRLPQTLVNRIAAGECVERPASVVKELVENALDAGAGRIDVQIFEGGRELIDVADDGCGMDADDLRLCIEPHATSKISSDDDLFAIHTMGFRGEALPSIGAVARLTITSRPRECDVAHQIRVAGGEITGPQPCAAPPGTRVEVRDLFYNVPAREKFLRTNQTEMGQISEQFARLALAYSGTALTLRSHSRLVHQLAATQDRRVRIADLLGPELAAGLLDVHRDSGGLRVDGLVAPPAQSRGSGKWEYVFVNGRFVRDRFVSHAVKEAYRSLIDPARYPVVFLFLTVDAAQVDVNVHPTKIEVRWRDSNFVHAQVLAALRDRFLSTRLEHALQPPAELDAQRQRVRDALVDFFTHRAPRQTALPLEPPLTPAAAAGAETDVLTGRGLAAAQQPDFPHAPAAAPPAAPVGHDSFPAPSAAAESWSPARRAMQIHRAYLVVETDDGVMIVDQHALHERVLYEELRRRIASRSLPSQRLLMPEVIQTPGDRLEVLETHADLLDRLGIELTAAGPHSVALHSFPALLERVAREPFVRELLDLLAQKGTVPDQETILHELLDMMACKAAVKAGDALTADEMDALLAQRESAQRSSNCPHGRPTTLHLSLRDLEKQFKRR